MFFGLNDVGFLAAASAAAGPGFDFLDPANIGQPVEGGFFAGLISHTADGNPTHALIVAPRATGATGTDYTLTTSLAWKVDTTDTAGTASPFDGVANTAAMVTAGIANYPAAEFCVGLSIGGFTDWYLPAPAEMDIAYFNLKPTTAANVTNSNLTNLYSVPARSIAMSAGYPAQTQNTLFQSNGAEAFVAAVHWTSQQGSAGRSWICNYSDGAINQTGQTRTVAQRVRAFRRIAL
jgi:hypothetical protein